MHDAPVTVAITNFNGEAYLTWCLEAVRNLKPAPAEILLVDNASTDGSVALVRERFPEVKLILLPKNEGPCPARNRGLEEASHPLVFQLDCDVAPRPETLSLLLQALEAGGPSAVACQPRACFANDPGRIHYDHGWFHYLGLMTLENFYQPLPQVPERVREVDAVIAMALLLKKEAVLQSGGYDPAYFILFEDHDLSYRLRSKDYKLLFVPDARVDHREGTEGVSFRSAAYPRKRAFLQSRNRWILLAKNHGCRTLLLTLPGLLLFELVWLVFSVREGFLSAYLKGKLSFLRMLPRLLAARKKIQAGRILKDRSLLSARNLTFSPLIRKSRTERFLEKSLSRILRAWWILVKPLCG